MIELLIYLLLIFIPLVTGTLIEKSHYKSIRKREAELINIPLLTLDCDFDELDNDFESRLVSGSAVLAADGFKIALSSLRSFFGGQISAFETLIDRARRESVLRLRQKAIDCDAIMNLRLETSYLGKNKIVVFAYATAIYHKKQLPK
jgi:uncharacterized protein YbjQ (UPF0145 family)